VPRPARGICDGEAHCWPPLTKPARRERRGEGGWVIGAFQLIQSDILAAGHGSQMASVKLFVTAPNSCLEVQVHVELTRNGVAFGKLVLHCDRYVFVFNVVVMVVVNCNNFYLL